MSRPTVRACACACVCLCVVCSSGAHIDDLVARVHRVEQREHFVGEATLRHSARALDKRDDLRTRSVASNARGGTCAVGWNAAAHDCARPAAPVGQEGELRMDTNGGSSCCSLAQQHGARLPSLTLLGQPAVRSRTSTHSAARCSVRALVGGGGAAAHPKPPGPPAAPTRFALTTRSIRSSTLHVRSARPLPGVSFRLSAGAGAAFRALHSFTPGALPGGTVPEASTAVRAGDGG